jgi:hypothetical protein
VVAVVAVVVSEVAVVVSVVAVIEEVVVVVVSEVEEVAVDFEVAEDVETDINKKTKRNCFVFFLPVICHFLYDNNN